jgi:hypothetical protein
VGRVREAECGAITRANYEQPSAKLRNTEISSVQHRSEGGIICILASVDLAEPRADILETLILAPEAQALNVLH